MLINSGRIPCNRHGQDQLCAAGTAVPRNDNNQQSLRKGDVLFSIMGGLQHERNAGTIAWIPPHILSRMVVSAIVLI